MEFINIEGLHLNPQANNRDITNLELNLNSKLPTSYKMLLEYSNGLSTNLGISIYGTQDFTERNETWKTEVYAPGFISIGDDSGGRVILMREVLEKDELVIVDSGDMNPKNGLLITTDLITWMKNGFKLEFNEKRDIDYSKRCKIIVVETQDGALKDLIKIKNILGLSIPTPELVKGAKNLPFVLTEEIPYGKANRIIEKLGKLNVWLEYQ
ncbi:SMI1/KNR4 family protein [Bacillus sp. BGMRC 2118]|nr:SMI1/KNR4 family protein [Bacillus sp. BGMRC 2118]